MSDACARPGCKELRKHDSAYCSDDCYAQEIWRAVREFNRRLRRRRWRFV